MSVASLSQVPKRTIDGGSENDFMCHALESVSYLKVDKRNFIQYEFDGDNKIISIMNQYKKINKEKGGEQLKFETI